MIHQVLNEKYASSLLTVTFLFNISAVPQEIQIVNTFHSSVQANGPSEKLVDEKGLDGKYVNSPKG